MAPNIVRSQYTNKMHNTHAREQPIQLIWTLSSIWCSIFHAITIIKKRSTSHPQWTPRRSHWGYMHRDPINHFEFKTHFQVQALTAALRATICPIRYVACNICLRVPRAQHGNMAQLLIMIVFLFVCVACALQTRRGPYSFQSRKAPTHPIVCEHIESKQCTYIHIYILCSHCAGSALHAFKFDITLGFTNFDRVASD